MELYGHLGIKSQNNAADQGYLPRWFKQGNKKRMNEDVSHYRTIRVIPIIGKTLEN